MCNNGPPGAPLVERHDVSTTGATITIALFGEEPKFTYSSFRACPGYVGRDEVEIDVGAPIGTRQLVDAATSKSIAVPGTSS